MDRTTDTVTQENPVRGITTALIQSVLHGFGEHHWRQIIRDLTERLDGLKMCLQLMTSSSGLTGIACFC